VKDCGQKWWKEAKFGMFIHWGLYSILAGEWNGRKVEGIGEWIMNRLDIPREEYRKLAAQFNPVKFDADAWVQVAKDAGMKYLTITAKHHDGFAMYHSHCSKYNIVDATPFGRDPMAELAVACKKAGIVLCFYYSQAQDWDEDNGLYAGKPERGQNFDQYLYDKCLPQVKELLTQYGDIGMLWFDTPMSMTYEQSKIIFDTVKAIQPNCIVSGRIGNRIGEYMSTGDNWLPSMPFAGDWEVPATLNDTWGFKADDHNWKSASDLIDILTRINSRGGNYLLNVGPDAEGVIPQPSVDILREMGHYVRGNADSVYATSMTPMYPYDVRWCNFTSRPFRLYAHILDGRRKMQLPCIKTPIEKLRILETGREIEFTQTLTTNSSVSRFQCEIPQDVALPKNYVLEFVLKDENVEFDTLEGL
jgi:alpha-L-fucosidase